MRVVLPTAMMIQNFTDTANYLAGTIGYPPITLEASSEIIFTMVEESVFNRLRWTKKHNDLDALLSKHIPFWATRPETSDPACLKASMNLTRLGIERPEIFIENHLDNIMGPSDSDEMWMVWHTLTIGLDMVLERGTDFRILEHERRLHWRQ